MSKSLLRQSKGGGVVPAVASGLLPGLGQLVNGESSKGVGVFVVAAGAGILTQVPLIGGIAAVVAGGTWLYGVVDGYLGKRRR
jgi:TM2 domain-containing membrane protein YozV